MRRFQLQFKLLDAHDFLCPLPQLLDVLPLFLFRVRGCRFVATAGEIVRRMRKCAPLDKAGEHRIDIGTDHVQGIEGLARRTAADKPATGLGPERDFPELSPH